MKVALVSGAAQGLGLVTASHLAKLGLRVILSDLQDLAAFGTPRKERIRQRCDLDGGRGLDRGRELGKAARGDAWGSASL